MQPTLNFKPLSVLNFIYYLRKLLFVLHNRRVQVAAGLLLLAGTAIYDLYFSREVLSEPLLFDIVGDFASVLFSLVIPILAGYLIMFFVRPVLNLFFVDRFIDINKLDKKPSNELQKLVPTTLKTSEQLHNIEIHHAYGFKLPNLNATLWQMSINIYGRRLVIPLHYVIVHIPINLDGVPHFYLDSTKNGKRLINFLKIPDVGLDLEGPFYKHFRIHHGRNRETDIRYILPPNRMEKILDYSKDVDFEFDKKSCWLITKGYCVSELDVRQFIKIASKIDKSFNGNNPTAGRP